MILLGASRPKFITLSSLVKLFAKLTAAFKGTTTHTRKIRETIRRYPETLIDFTRDLLDTANEILKANGKSRGLLLIFDNLDRYDPVNIDAILVRSSHQVRQMSCHAIFTFPISLAYKPISGKVGADYGLEVPLPMLALRRKSAPWAETVAAAEFEAAHVAQLRKVLSERIVIEALFTDPQDADLLVKMSGGVLRDLIQLVAQAATYTEEEKITSEAVRSAINDLRSTYMRFLAVTPHDYRCLAIFARHKSLSTQKDNFSEPINRLLFNGCLLEYLEDGKPWHDVHPVLIETEEFRNACNALDNNVIP